MKKSFVCLFERENVDFNSWGGHALETQFNASGNAVGNSRRESESTLTRCFSQLHPTLFYS